MSSNRKGCSSNPLPVEGAKGARSARSARSPKGLCSARHCEDNHLQKQKSDSVVMAHCPHPAAGKLSHPPRKIVSH
ncbi:hypothetical protein E2C01_014211 [Portunus trituberculatus]|uniref:Uncharacterized protein n=1 Tax=Portunus trituberculatus TaxID=210409 RepID=A0A5B7DJ96_PORTR|nr:hypothetical protein [Portunus trituberculatus]